MSKVSMQGIVGLLCLGLLISIVVGCSSLPFNIGGQSNPAPKPTPKPTPKPQTSQPKPPDVKSIIDAGKSERKAGKYNQAIASFKKALAAEPGNKEATTLLAETKKERQDLIDIHMKQGLQHNNEENLQAALKEWEAVLALDPTNTKALEYKQRTQKKLDALQ